MSPGNSAAILLMKLITAIITLCHHLTLHHCYHHRPDHDAVLLCDPKDPKTGLPEHRRTKLLSIFQTLDKVWPTLESSLCTSLNSTLYITKTGYSGNNISIHSSMEVLMNAMHSCRTRLERFHFKGYRDSRRSMAVTPWATKS